MDYLPLFARVQGVPCLVVGGGSVALRKTRLLLRARAAVTLVAPTISDELRELADQQHIQIVAREFTPEILDDHQFIVAATSDPAVNNRVAAAAAAAMRFCNVVDDRELSSAILPAIVDRSPLLIAISSGGNSPVLATQIRQQLQTSFPPAVAQLAELTGRWRSVVKEQIKDPAERRTFWQTLLAGPLRDQVYANDIDAAEETVRVSLANGSRQSGMVWIVGAGPGDPELLTLKAARVLRDAEVIVHDRLVTSAILDMARRDADFISVGKRGGSPSIKQDEINELLIRLAREGKKVCRLKGGDPFIFGRGGEEIEALDAAGLRWEVIPGISAANGCAAAAGLPLTHRKVARTLVMTTAQAADEFEPDWNALAQEDQTVVFYMAVRLTERVCRQLVAAGSDHDCPAVLIENGSTPQQRLVRGTLETLPELARTASIGSPALLIVGVAADQTWLQGQPKVSAGTEEIWSQAAKN